jgi:hypothetical protein
MRANGQLGDDEITAHDRAFATGDRVILLRNNASLDVDNGDQGVVIAVDTGRRALTVQLDAGREVGLPGWYLDAAWVDHGYALTAHNSRAPQSPSPWPRATSIKRPATRSPPAPATPPTSTLPRDPRLKTMNASMDRPGRPRTPSRGLPATSATAARKRSPLTNPRAPRPAPSKPPSSAQNMTASGTP